MAGNSALTKLASGSARVRPRPSKAHDVYCFRSALSEFLVYRVCGRANSTWTDYNTGLKCTLVNLYIVLYTTQVQRKYNSPYTHVYNLTFALCTVVGIS